MDWCWYQIRPFQLKNRNKIAGRRFLAKMYHFTYLQLNKSWINNKPFDILIHNTGWKQIQNLNHSKTSLRQIYFSNI